MPNHKFITKIPYPSAEADLIASLTDLNKIIIYNKIHIPLQCILIYSTRECRKCGAAEPRTDKSYGAANKYTRAYRAKQEANQSQATRATQTARQDL